MNDPAEILGPLIPVAFFVMIGAIFIVPRYLRSKEREAMQATLRAAIERGQPLPPEVIDAISTDAKPLPSAGRDLRIGIIWLGVGLGFAAMAYALGYSEDASDAFWPLLGISAFPTFVGIAFLIMSVLNRGKGKA